MRLCSHSPSAVPWARPLPDPHAVPRTSPRASAAMLLLLALCWGLPLCAGSPGEARSWGDTSEQVSGNLGDPGRPLGAGCCPFPLPPLGAWPLDRLLRPVLDATKGGTTPYPGTLSPLFFFVPQPSARELLYLLVTCARAWTVKFHAELCLGLQGPAEPNLLGSCYLRTFLLVFCCYF